jgi:integrase
MQPRHQKGYLFKSSGWWFVRYCDTAVTKGEAKRVLIAKKLVPISAEYRSKRSVQPIAEEFLRPINEGLVTPQSSMSIGEFVRTEYLPFVEREKRPSTTRGYRDIWKNHLNPRCGDRQLRDFRTVDGERLMRSLANGIRSRTSLYHIKALLSGVFKHAIRLGILNGSNPVRDVSIPAAPEGRETQAYSLEQVLRILPLLPERAAAVIAVAAFSGLRKGEIRGLLWEHYSGNEIRVMQSIWNTHVTQPKTRKSKAAVPVVPILCERLDRFRASIGNPQSGLIFVAGNGSPLNLDNLARREIKPVIEAVGISWFGWHAFRRGLATNLYSLGVSDKVIQGILRHAQVSTTMNLYVKGVPKEATAAMELLQRTCSNLAVNQLSQETSKLVN